MALLLDHGAAVDFRGGQFGSALNAAAGAGHAKVIRLLVDKGAKLGLALQIASLVDMKTSLRSCLIKVRIPTLRGRALERHCRWRPLPRTVIRHVPEKEHYFAGLHQIAVFEFS